MKKILLLTALTVLYCGVYGQRFKKEYLLHGEIGLGASIPSGYFGATDAGNAYSGHATLGAGLNIELGYKIIETFGVGFKYNTSLNPVNNSSKAKSLDKNLKDYIYLNQDNLTISESMVSSGWYWSNCFLGGIFIAIPLDDFEFSFMTYAGLSSLVNPKQEYVATLSDNSKHTIKQSKDKGGGLCYNIAISASYQFLYELSGFINVSYLRSQPTIAEITTTVKPYDRSGYSRSNSWDPMIEIFGITAGVRYTIDLKEYLNFRRKRY
jgi:hypothetical protein